MQAQSRSNRAARLARSNNVDDITAVSAFLAASLLRGFVQPRCMACRTIR